MQKIFIGSFIALLCLGAMTSPVAALDISVHSDGSVRFYQPQVLGDEDQEKPEEQKSEDHKDEVKPPERQEEHKAEDQKSEERKSEDRKTETRRVEVRHDERSRNTNTSTKAFIQEGGRPIKVLPINSAARLRIKPDGKNIELNIESKNSSESLDKKSVTSDTFRTLQKVNTDEVRMELPAQTHPLVTPESESETESEQEKEKPAEVKEVEQDRAERTDETVQVQTERHDDGTVEFQFESRNVKAKAKGVNVVVDPQSHNVMITTPSGQEHTLIHLPDQAITRMQAAGMISADERNQLGTGAVGIKTTSDGRVVYEIKKQKQKKVLGIFPRQVETQVELDDKTGTVKETEVPATNIIGQILNSLSR